MIPHEEEHPSEQHDMQRGKSHGRKQEKINR
jgi:hypothetical protein